jgi:hypothetical protein
MIGLRLIPTLSLHEQTDDIRIDILVSILMVKLMGSVANSAALWTVEYHAT